jgi:hypothetical protein
MKKTFVMLMVLVFVVGIAGIAMAASNPFTDVPQGHWAYAAVDKLTAAGIVDGYGDGTFRGDRTMTRYEMAQVVAKAMARSDKADAEQKALIDKLAVEFADELNNLGVRVSKLEDKTKIGLNYESRIRYVGDSNKAVGTQGSNAYDFRQRIYFNGAVNDRTTYGARLATDNITFGSGSASVAFDRMYFTFSDVLFDQVTLGRFSTLGVTNGLMNASTGNNDGIKIVSSLGDNTKFTGMFFDVKGNSDNGANEVGIANIDFKLGESSGLNFGYETAKINAVENWPTTSDIASGKTRSYDVGAYTKFGAVYLTGEYVKTSFRDTNEPDAKAYAVQISNGVNPYLYPTYPLLVDANKEHSNGFALSYRRIEDGAVPLLSCFGPSATALTGTDNGANHADFAADNDVKGFFFTYQNVLSKGVVFTAEYQDLKSVTDDTLKDKTYNASFQFFF